MAFEHFEGNPPEDNKKDNQTRKLETKGTISPEVNKILHDLSEKTGIEIGEYHNLYTLYKQARIVENVKEFEEIASAPRFEWIRKKIKEMNSLPEILDFLGSKSAGDIAKEEENFKKLMGDENDKE
ncbi:MAG: hypothetical protein ACP5RX_00345 [Minisyncoccia bacterium]